MQIKNKQLMKYFSIISIAFMLTLAVHATQLSYGGEIVVPVCVEPPSDLVSWWTLDENSDETTASDSVGDNTGSYVNSLTQIAGLVDGALSFVDVTDYVEVPDDISLQPQRLTIDAWVRGSDIPGSNGYIVAKGAQDCSSPSYALYSAGGDSVKFLLRADGASWTAITGPDIWDGVWHHVAGTYDGSFMTLYVDGGQVAQVAYDKVIDYTLSTHDDLIFGSYEGTCSLPFNGDVDEIELFSRALDSTEIDAIYNADFAGKCKESEPQQPLIEVEKTWTHTDYNWDPVCLDGDGFVDLNHPEGEQCHSDVGETIHEDFRQANIFNNEDPDDDVLADRLAQDDDDKYLVHAQVKSKNDRFQNTNPGAFYALTTVVTTSSTTLSSLTVWENYDDCTDQDEESPTGGEDPLGLKLHNQKKLDRSVKVAIATPNGDVTEITDEIYDGMGGSITDINDDSAHVEINREFPEGSILYLLVKFQDTLKNFNTDDGIFDGMCKNTETVHPFIDGVVVESSSTTVMAELRITNDIDRDGTIDKEDTDDDGDGVLDVDDNCPTVTNPGQIDDDGDGVGLACDADDTDETIQ